MTTIQKLHAIEEEKVIYAILYRRAGVAFQFYEGDRSDRDFRKDLEVDTYYPTFEEAVSAEYDRMQSEATQESAQGTIEDKLNLESEHALLLEEAYQLGYRKVRNGCLIPLTEKLEAIITTETTKARADELEKAVQQFIFNTKSNPNNFSEYATARLKALQKEPHDS